MSPKVTDENHFCLTAHYFTLQFKKALQKELVSALRQENILLKSSISKGPAGIKPAVHLMF